MSDKAPTIIKKYANRRLYDTGTSAYVTLEDLAVMVKRGDDFTVSDAKSGEDITRSVLTQIIFEQEGKGGQSLLPIAFLRQLIRFYGDSMQMMVPSYLELALKRLTSEQDAFREQCAAAFGAGPIADAARPVFGTMEEQARKNMEMFRQALSLFQPFPAAVPAAPAPPPVPESAPRHAGEDPGEALDALRRQLDAMRQRLDTLAKD